MVDVWLTSADVWLTSADLAKEVYSSCDFGNVYLKGCLWIGFNTSLLVSSGFGVPFAFASRLTRFLYVAEFNFRVPHPCWFARQHFVEKCERRKRTAIQTSISFSVQPQ